MRFTKMPEKAKRARRLRRDMTDVEKGLWNRLRGAQVAGVPFRRQHPIGNYVVDFCALPLKLIIELDGGQHGEEHAVVKDQTRTQWLVNRGFRVLRFWNSDVVENLDGVLQVIAHAVAEQKSTPP
jgi:very-short-patch-repair endonuclease